MSCQHPTRRERAMNPAERLHIKGVYVCNSSVLLPVDIWCICGSLSIYAHPFRKPVLCSPSMEKSLLCTKEVPHHTPKKNWISSRNFLDRG